MCETDPRFAYGVSVEAGIAEVRAPDGMLTMPVAEALRLFRGLVRQHRAERKRDASTTFWLGAESKEAA